MRTVEFCVKEELLIFVLLKAFYETAFKIGYGLGTSGIVWKYWDIFVLHLEPVKRWASPLFMFIK